MTNYGMFSDRGNLLVDGVVRTARREQWDWGKTVRYLTLLARAHPNTAGEALDTAVREAVYLELGYGAEQPFHG
jgi:hypothetical protein